MEFSRRTIVNSYWQHLAVNQETKWLKQLFKFFYPHIAFEFYSYYYISITWRGFGLVFTNAYENAIARDTT